MNVLIIGSGIAAVTFAETFRKLSDTATITLLTREQHGYYARPMLSRGFSEPEIEEIIILKTFDDLRRKNIQVIESVDVTGIDPLAQHVTLQGHVEIEQMTYDKLVIATGSAAFIPPPFRPYRDHFFLLNSLEDLIALRRFRETIQKRGRKPEWAILGGGLIGCELASDLATAGDRVCLYHAMDRLMERQLVEEDSELLLSVMQDLGVEIRLNQNIERIEKNSGKTRVAANDQHAEFDAAVVCCGFKPRTELAQNAGLDCNRGILVNRFLQTSHAQIYSLGDVAELPDGRIYAYIIPIRDQARWLAGFMNDPKGASAGWQPPEFNPEAKVHGFIATHPYRF